MSRREGKKKLETIAIVPQMLITPEMLLTDELCLGRNGEWDRGGIDTGALGQKPGIRSLDTLKF